MLGTCTAPYPASLFLFPPTNLHWKPAHVLWTLLLTRTLYRWKPSWFAALTPSRSETSVATATEVKAPSARLIDHPDNLCTPQTRIKKKKPWQPWFVGANGPKTYPNMARCDAGNAASAETRPPTDTPLLFQSAIWPLCHNMLLVSVHTCS